MTTTTTRFRLPAVFLAVAAMIASLMVIVTPPASASHDIYVVVEGVSDNECTDEGDNGTLEFPLSLQMQDPITGEYTPTLADRKITVDFETIEDGTADEGADYQFTSGTVTFNEGDRTKTANVPVICDSVAESEETFSAFFFDLQNAQFKDGGDDKKVTGTIQNDGTAPPGPQFFISDASPPTVTEGPDASVSFVVSISDTSDCVPLCRVSVAANDGTATAADDYEDNSDSYEWTAADDCEADPSACRETFTVDIKNDTDAEPLEQFTADLSDDPSPGTIKDGQGVAKISDDDASKVSVNDATRSEGVGSFGVPFVIDQPVGQALYVVWHTIDGSAKAGSDYNGKTSAVTEIPASSSGANGSVTVIDDADLENWEERFYVEIDCLETDNNTSCDSPASDSVATLGDTFGRETIQDNEPKISVSDASSGEGESMTFEVTLAELRPGQRISVDYATADGSATANEDYKPKSGTFCWDDDDADDTCASDLTRTVKVETLQDGDAEGSETFNLVLSNAQFAGTDASNPGEGTITDDDDFTVSAGAAKSGESATEVSFTGSATGGTPPYTFTWDFGDGSAKQTGTTVKHRFADTGTYTVTLAVTDSSGGSAEDTTTATITDSGQVNRSSGLERISTAIDVSSDHWNQADTVLLATAYNYPDALAAGPLSKQLDAPLLLTGTGDDVPDNVKAELDRLNAQKVIILGGNQAISQAQADELAASGYQTQRIADVSRFGTAADIAVEIGPSDNNEVTVALGAHPDPNQTIWADSLSAGSFASLPDPLPALLTHSDFVPQETLDALDQLNTKKVFLLGGTKAITPTVEAQLEAEGYTVQRVAGANRFETSVEAGKIAMGRYPAGQVHPVFATGSNYPDGLTSGALAGKVTGPVILVVPDDLDNIPGTRQFLRDNANRFDVGTVVGGEKVVSDNVKNQARSDIDKF